MTITEVLRQLASTLARAPDRIGTLFDGAIAPLAPTWARNRTLSRLQYRQLRGATRRHYEHDRHSRLSLTNRAKERGPIERSRGELPVTRARAWELYHTNPYAAGAVDSLVVNLVGCGIRPMPRLRRDMGEVRKRRASRKVRRVADEWNRWADHCDVTGRESFYQLQSLLMRERLIAGESLLRRHTIKPGRRLNSRQKSKVPLAYEVIPSERLAHDYDREIVDQATGKISKKVVQGVEFDELGQIKGYWIHPNHPNDSHGNFRVVRFQPDFVPASEILHTFHRRQAGQVRGMSPFSRAAHIFEALSHYLNAELTKADIAASVVFAAYKDDLGLSFPKTGEDQEGEDDQGNQEGYVEAGSIWRGKPNERLEVLSPTVTSTAFAEFVALHIRALARAFNCSYELLARDLSKVTYLSMRAGENEDRRHWEPQQEDFNSEINAPVWDDFLDSAVLVAAVPKALESDLECDYIRPARTWVDPVKDLTAMKLGIEAGLESPLEIIRANGGNPEQILDDLAEFKEMAEERGISLSVFLESAAAAELAKTKGMAA